MSGLEFKSATIEHESRAQGRTCSRPERETEMVLWDESDLKSAKESKSLEGTVNL